MGAGEIGYIVGSFLVQGIIGYIVIWLFNARRHPTSAFIGATVATLILAGFTAAGAELFDVKPLIAWLFVVGFIYWRINKEPLDLEEESVEREVPAVEPNPKNESLGKNYFSRHWRGEMSLGVSYWVNGALIAGVVPIVALRLLSEYVESRDSLYLVAWFYIFAITGALAIWIWGVVGIWRSAGKYKAAGGGGFAAGAAKTLVVLGAISVAGQMINSYVPLLKDMMLIVAGKDSLGSYKITLLADGQSIRIQGAMSTGVADEFESLLKAAPGVKTLVLNSNGGRLLEGKLLAAMVGERGLNTYVEGICFSTCTFVFLAGRDRAATPTAKIGFHSPHSPSGDMQQEGMRYMLDLYRKAGLSSQFLERVKATPNESMWYPSRDELIASKVITRVSLGGETTHTFTDIRSKEEFVLILRQLPLWRAIEVRYPHMVTKSVNAAWSVKEGGGNDGQILSASRVVVAEMIPQLLSESDIGLVEKYVSLVIEQAKAARAVSYQACYALINAQLNPYSVFPPALIEREKELTIAMLEAPPVKGRKFKAAESQLALQVVGAKVSKEHIDAASNPQNYQARPEMACDGVIAVYSAVLGLPQAQRSAALEGMFRS